MIRLSGIRHGPLRIPELEIGPGISSVIGRNGSGKTTLLRLLAGIDLPEEGEVQVDGISPRDTEIGWVGEFPDRNLLFSGVSEEIAAPLRFRHLPPAEIRDSIASLAEILGIGALAGRQVRQLSGGEKVLVALASALIIRPRVLVLDEYDSHLDAKYTGDLARIIRQSGTPYIIHCTQDMEAAAAGDAVIFLENGSPPRTGRPEDMFASLAGTAFCPLSRRCRS